MSRKLLVLAFGGMLIAAPLAVTPGSLSAEERGEIKIAATALGVPGAPAPAYGVQGAPAYGVQGAPAYGFSGYPMWGVQGAPAYGVQGAPAYGMVVWIPAVVGGAAGPGATPVPATSGGTGAPQPVLCMVEPTNSAVIAEANVPAGQKVAVIANTETACRAINGTVANQAAGGARAVN